MFGYDATVVVFTLGAFAVWGYAFRWAVKQPKYPWYHAWILVLATLFWWIGESLAVRLGKYEYPSFPFRFNVPGAGGPLNPGWLENWVLGFLPAGQVPPWKLDPSCMADSYAIPLPVVALEAALLFGFYRLASSVLRNDMTVQWGRVQWWRQHGLRLRTWRPALATGGLCALLLVNVFAVLDPVVSTTQWCQPGQTNPVDPYLPFGLWNWFTTARHPGYWFGVPIINYAAWFAAAFVFGLGAGLDDHRKPGLVRQYKTILGYVVATAVLLVIFVFSALFLLRGIDRLLTLSSTRGWHLSVIAGLLLVALLACFGGRRKARTKVDRISILPKAAAFGYSAWLLLRVPHPAIVSIFLVTLVIAVIALRWPYIGRRVFGDVEPPPQPAEALASGVETT